MDPVEYVKLLARRLSFAIPTEFHVEELNGDLVLYRDGHPGRSGSHTWQFFGAIAKNYRGQDERFIAASQCAMSDLQDFIAEGTGIPWPAATSRMPEPHARIRQGQLSLWWGEESSPDFVLDPIELA